MDPETYPFFRLEAGDLHRQLGSGAMRLERTPDPKLVAQLLRQAHTLKGAARVVRAATVADCAHAIETALIPFRDSGAATREAIDEVLAQLDRIEREFRDLDAEARPASAPGTTASASASDQPAQIVRSDAREIDRLIDGIAEASSAVSDLLSRGEDFQHLRRLLELLASQFTATGLRQQLEELGSWHRVVSLLDEVRGLGAKLEQRVGERSETAAQELRQMREEAELLRLVPAEIMFPLLERAVRDGAQAAGSTATLRVEGGQLRLEATLLGALQPALLQLVRNALAHGIEPPTERERAGKPPRGTIAVTIDRTGDSLRVRCADDGRGIDRESVRRRAAAKAATGSFGAPADDQQLLQLLLDAGVSTSAQVTQQAGRGVGMDIVRDAIARLGGRLALSTSPAGTTFELTVPASLSSIEALLTRIGDAIVAVPLGAVAAIMRIESADVVGDERGETLVHEGRSIPLHRLERAFSVAAGPHGGLSAILVTHRGALAALGASQVIGSARILVRPVPRLAPVAPFIAGIAVDADGQLQYVIDTDQLIGAAAAAAPAHAPGDTDRLPILIIDDSLTTRMLEQSILRSAGYAVETANSAEEGLARARERRFALFLVDVEMPGMSGYDFVRQTRADPELTRVPAILVTSRGEAADRKQGFEAGARAYIVKGEFDQRALLRHIRDLVGF